MKSKKKHNKILSVFGWAFLFLLLELGLLLNKTKPWAQDMFGGVTAEEIIFHMKVPLQGTDVSTIYSFIQDALLPSLKELIFFIMLFFVLPRIERALRSRLEKRYNKSVRLVIKHPKKKQPFSKGAYLLWKIPARIFAIFALIVFVYNTYSICKVYSVGDYIKQQLSSSKWIEEQYVQPDENLLTWPKKKRNLIYLFLESMESTYTSEEYGGAFKENLIPELTALANENISFTNKENLLGGAVAISNTGWTIAGMVAQTSGIPLKLPINGNAMDEYSVFLPGVTSIGDLLEDAGYHNCLMIGSDAAFGGRKNYFEQHGNYEIRDYNWALETGVIPEGYHVFWGMEDESLFRAAKDTLLEFADSDEPFNLTLLTVDSHFPDGYRCELCQYQHNNNYKDAISCSSRQIASFIEWIQQQDFYEDTTIVISGDHLTMAADLTEEMESNDRSIYNCIINPACEPSNDHERIFTTMDMFPTTLAAMGVTIDGDRLGLGTNLFGDQQTLTEEFGLSFEDDELMKNSDFYNKVLLYP